MWRPSSLVTNALYLPAKPLEIRTAPPTGSLLPMCGKPSAKRTPPDTMLCHHSLNIWTTFASPQHPAHPNHICQPTGTNTTHMWVSNLIPKDTTLLLTTYTLMTTCMLQWASPGLSGPCVAALLGSSASLATMNQTYAASNQTWRNSSRMKSVMNVIN